MVLFIIIMILIYYFVMGARRRRWMPFRPPLSTAGGRFITNSSSSRFIISYYTKPQRPWSTLAEEIPCVESDRSIDPMPWEGQTAHHWGDVCF